MPLIEGCSLSVSEIEQPDEISPLEERGFEPPVDQNIQGAAAEANGLVAFQ